MDTLTQRISVNSPVRLFGIVLAIALIAGIGTGYVMSSGNKAGGVMSPSLPGTPPQNAQQDTRTFRDFAEGTVANKPASSSDKYSEGAYLLVRQGAVPVALTSSVVDLSQYVGKKVKVYGETQKALQEGWLMDVGKVEVE